MGGVVLETYADKIGEKRHSEGHVEMAKLATLLVKAGRAEEIERCTQDADFRQSLLIEFKLI